MSLKTHLLPDLSRPRFGIVMHPPVSKGGRATYVVEDRLHGREALGATTDYQEACRVCHLLSTPSDLAAVQQSLAAAAQLNLEL